MGISKGTKLTDNPKTKTFKVRLDDEIFEKLETISRKDNVSKSEVVRKGIEIQFKQK